MAKIEKFPVWKDGVIYEVDDLVVSIVNDDLATSAVFYYRLSVAPVEEVDGEGVVSVVSPGATVADGNVSIGGEDYQEWGDSGDVNAEAYEYVAGKLGLVLV
jgi:hypothetical protein